MTSGDNSATVPAEPAPPCEGQDASPVDPVASSSSSSSSNGNQQQQQQQNKDWCIALQDVQEAAERIHGLAHITPVLTSRSLDDLAGRHLYFKVEALQKTGSFKFRGAVNAIRHAFDNNNNNDNNRGGGGGVGREEDTNGESHSGVGTTDKGPATVPYSSSNLVITHSSGNHAQAVALAAKTVHPSSIAATIVMPRNTPLVKKAAVQDFGGTVVLVDNSNQAREDEADRLAHEAQSQGRTCWFVHPSENPFVIAGQGPVSWELVQQLQTQFQLARPDVVIIPVGGGGLAAGNTVALRGLLGDAVKIVLAEPEVMDDAHRSFYAQQLLSHDPSNPLDSVADGLKTTLGPNTWPIVRDGVNDICIVSEMDILRATKLVWERLKVCIEPSAGVGVAVALYSQVFRTKYPPADYPRVAIVLCGGKVDVLSIATKMAELGL